MNEPSSKNRNEDIDSKIADFMADIDEIVLGKKSSGSSNHSASEWTTCFDDASQSVYYWNTKTNECSWDPPTNKKHDEAVSNNTESTSVKKRSQVNHQHLSPKKVKKQSLIAEYTSSESETTDKEDAVDDIDELLEEVLEKEDKLEDKPVLITDPYPSFEADCRAAINRLSELGDRNKDVLILRVQIETRLNDVRTGHLSKAYAVKKLEESLLQIEAFEKFFSKKTSPRMNSDPVKPTISPSEIALLSLPPPPPPPSPPPTEPMTTTILDDPTLQMFYAQLNSNPVTEPTCSSLPEKTGTTKAELHSHHHKEKKTKPSKTLPTSLIQKWTHARQELHGTGEMNEP